MSIRTNRTTITVDGSEMQLYAAYPDRPNGGGVMVFQEAFGITSHIRDVTERIAEAGFVAVAPELFHRSAPAGFEGDPADFGSVTEHIQAISTATLEADSRATYEWLRTAEGVTMDRIGCIGFCMGGRCSYVANAILPLKAAVSYYGGRIAPDLLPRAAEQHAPILFFWGGLDKHITPEVRGSVIAAMRDAGKDYMNVEISYADHGFLRPGYPAYNEAATREAWPLTLAFLRTHMGMES